MSKKKKSSPALDENEQYTIKVVEKVLNKKHYYPPSTLVAEDDDGKNWFSFREREYYPVSIFDKNNKLIHTKGTLKMKMKLECDDDTVIPYEVASTPFGDGIFWFTAINVHTCCKCLLTFSCDVANISSLDFEINVVEKEKSAKKKSKIAQKQKEIDEEQSDNGMVIQENEDIAPADADSANLAVIASTDALKYGERILPYPKNITLSNGARIDPPLPITGKSAAGKQISWTVITGAELKLVLPSILTRALLDDRVIHSVKISEYFAAATANLLHGQRSASSATLPKAFSTPSVTQLLYDLEKRAAQQKDVEITVQHMRSLFELVFETHILYAHERAAMLGYLQQLQQQRLCYCDHFGVYYFLRLLVFMVTGLEVAEIAPERTAGKRKRSNSDDESEEEQRKDTAASKANIRKCKNTIAKMQEVLNTAVAMLEEQAHVLFF